MVIPFIGAGVSNKANHPREKDLANINEMQRNVQKALNAKCKNEGCSLCIVKKELCDNRDNTNDKQNNTNDMRLSFDKLCELWEWSCSENHQNNGNNRCKLIYDILKIHEFTNLEPTDAHYYIAYLAREGLIDEIITTNYDTCMEKAYCNTYGLENPFAENTPALVISTLSEYRDKGGKKFTRNPVMRCLKIYKINGCAGKLPKKEEHGSENCKCNTILLTERDLQDWRHRSWARDLFRDRMRSHTILFSGFGSDEPQVRFTAMQICEEFALQKEDGIFQHKNGEIWDKQNAPFIAGYEDKLSFSQMQIMSAFAQSHGALLNPEELYSNSFVGSDIKFFNLNDSSDKLLKADIFWKRLFQAAFWRIFQKMCKPDSPAVSFLSSALPCADVLMVDVLKWLIPENDAKFPFGRYPEMLELVDDEKVIPLIRWIEQVKGNQPKKGWYNPLIENSRLIPIILMSIYLLIGLYDYNMSWQELSNKVSVKDGHLGLYVDTSHIFKSEHVRVYLITKNAANNLPSSISWSEHKKINTAIQIVVDDRHTAKRMVELKCSDENIKVVPVRQLSLLQLFREARNIEEAKRKFIYSLINTPILVDEGRPRVRRRTEPV